MRELEFKIGDKVIVSDGDFEFHCVVDNISQNEDDNRLFYRCVLADPNSIRLPRYFKGEDLRLDNVEN